MNTESIKVESIRIDGGTQIRSHLDSARVTSYTANYVSGVTMPFPTVFFDGAEYWLADGFHRVAAIKAVGWIDLSADVRAGTRRDAILFAVGANEEHGVPRTNEDKRRAVETLLRDEEWVQWSDRKIAEVCRVGHPLVASVRASVTGISSSEQPRGIIEPRKYVTRHGTPAVMNTKNIGKTPKCTDCGESDAAKFYTHPKNPSGYQRRCKQCDNAKRMENARRNNTGVETPKSSERLAIDENKETVRRLTEEGCTTSDIVERTGLKKPFVHHVRQEIRGPKRVLVGAIQDAEVIAHSWTSWSTRFDPRWASAPTDDKDALISALAKCRTAATKIIKLLKSESEGENK